MLNEDEGHARVRRRCREQGLESVEAASRCANAYNWKPAYRGQARTVRQIDWRYSRIAFIRHGVALRRHKRLRLSRYPFGTPDTGQTSVEFVLEFIVFARQPKNHISYRK